MMETTYSVGVLVGSLRSGSLNRKIAEEIIRRAPSELSFSFVEIGDLPFYNPDLEGDEAPASWKRLRGDIERHDAFLFVTPEYNRSVPAALKNAIDIGSRAGNPWNGKPAAVVTVSPGALGGFGANHHLRQSLVFLNVPTMQQPEVYLGGVTKLFDEQGELVERTGEFLERFGAAFAAWIARLTPATSEA